MKKNIDQFPSHPSRFLLPGPVGDLEVIADSPEAPVGVALICHPNPVQGGTMDNKVVTTMAKAFQKLGCATLRFNYRGVGKSEGICEGLHHDEAGELCDALFLYDWLRCALPGLPVSLAGFSFGAYIAAAVAHSKVAHQLLTVAPAVNLASFNAFTEVNAPWLVVQGDQDELIAHSAVKEFADHAASPVEYIEMAGAGHFFHGRLIELREILIQKLLG